MEITVIVLGAGLIVVVALMVQQSSENSRLNESIRTSASRYNKLSDELESLKKMMEEKEAKFAIDMDQLNKKHQEDIAQLARSYAADKQTLVQEIAKLKARRQENNPF